jgi:hypothetical protein
VLQRKRGATFERGETCERLAALTADVRAKKQLSEEAAEAFAAAGDLVRAREIAEQLIASHALDIDVVACATQIVMSLGDSTRAASWLRRALGAWDAAGRGTRIRGARSAGAARRCRARVGKEDAARRGVSARCSRPDSEVHSRHAAASSARASRDRHVAARAPVSLFALVEVEADQPTRSRWPAS